jgi:hypothetical protein
MLSPRILCVQTAGDTLVIKKHHHLTGYTLPTMQPHWQKYYNWVVIIASRGVGSLTMAALFMLKKYYLPAEAFASLGKGFAIAMMVASPLASPAIMMMSRRVIQTRSLGTDRHIILAWSILSSLAAFCVVIELLFRPSGVSNTGFLVSIFAFLLTSVLNSQFIIWLNESDQAKRSLLFIVFFIAAIPLSILVRYLTGIGQTDRSFAVEALLLSLPVMISMIATRPQKAEHAPPSYDFSAQNYAKYFVIVLFYSSIIGIDWTLGQRGFAKESYIDWANNRILLERVLLPALNILQVTVLWHLLRSSTRESGGDNDAISQKFVTRFCLIVPAVTALIIAAFWFLSGNIVGTLLPFGFGYLWYGLVSIFLDFFQAKYPLRRIVFVLVGITAVRSAVCWGSILWLGEAGYNIFWVTSSAVLLIFMFWQTHDQIKLSR